MNLLPGDKVSCIHDTEASGTIVNWIDNFRLKVEWDSSPSSTPWRAWYESEIVPHDYLVPKQDPHVVTVSY
jgi:hypothetical protein